MAISSGQKPLLALTFLYLFGQGNCILTSQKSGKSQSILKSDVCDNNECKLLIDHITTMIFE